MRALLTVLMLALALNDVDAVSISQDKSRIMPSTAYLSMDCTEAERSRIDHFEAASHSGQSFLVAASSDGNLIVSGLWPESEIDLVITGFRSDGEAVCSASCAVTTGSWAGTYLWVNPTSKDNKGRCRQIRLDVRLSDDISQGGPYYEIYDADMNARLFPPEPLRASYESHPYNEASPEGEVFRHNTLKFNTTSVKPSSWRVSDITIMPDRYHVTVKARAMIFLVSTFTSYAFVMDEDSGVALLLFGLDGDSLASTGLFSNPAPGKEGKHVFALERINSADVSATGTSDAAR